MFYSLIIKEEAIQDLQVAYDYYEEQKSGLGERFLDVIELHLEQVQAHPLHYPTKKKTFREAVVKKFPFIIVFEMEQDTLVVYAIFHTFRNPVRKHNF